MTRHLGIVVSFLLLTGCASTQLNYNTVDITGSLDGVYRTQVLNNVSKYIEDDWAIPSYAEIASGTVQTSNSISPSVSFPLSSAVARTGASVITATTKAGAGMTVAASDSWSQNWVLAPVTDVATLRRIRAIYRKIIFGAIDPEYDRIVSLLYRNKRTGWIYWRGGPAPNRLPPEGIAIVSLGMFGGYELVVAEPDYRSGVVQDMILAVMAGNDPLPAMAGATKARSVPPPKQRFQLIVPNAIIPPQ